MNAPLNTGIIASKRCNNVLIEDNYVYDGGEGAHGIMLHRSCDDSIILSEDNTLAHHKQLAVVSV